MSKLSQKYLAHHRYFSDLIEDFLAVTVCFPFTLTLYWVNDLVDRLNENPEVSPSLRSAAWRIGKVFLTFPLYSLKGLANWTITPILASYFTLLGKKPLRSRFILGQHFQRIAISLSPLVKTIFILFLSITAIITKTPGLGILSPWMVDVVMISSSLIIIFYPAVVYFSLYSTALLLSLGMAAVLFNLEGNYSLYRRMVSYSYDKVTSVVQQALFVFKISPFKNEEDIITGEVIKELPWNKIFVSNTNHAFDLSGLEGSANRNGLQNYYVNKGEGYPRFAESDIAKLEKHPDLEQNFPLLTRYLREHKQEYTKQNSKKISEQSINVLRELASKMQVTQSANHFAEEFVIAKLNFENHLAAITPEEKREIENINLLGGSDEEYALKKVLPKVYDGSWCKKGASRLIFESTDRIRQHEKTQDNIKVFWHQPQSTHWLGLDFVLRLR